MKAMAKALPEDEGDEVRTFAQAVQARVAEDILCGHLKPGIRLRLQTLCESYDVSMSPLREALSALAGRGLVVQEGQRGFRVATATPEDLRDIVETRIHIETLALRLSIERGGDEWEAGILAAHHRLERRQRSDDLLVDPLWERLHRTYHVSLICACGLSRLLEFYETLTDNFDRYRRLAVLAAGRHPRPKAAHAAIVKATLARDADRAMKLMAGHVRDSEAHIIHLLASEDFGARDNAPRRSGIPIAPK
ncbi:MAG TPA: FCD domain-containing protein [Xanthobacteraceae bacterium]|jgi:GntR family carbon starvation induced transcriptional regulator|nr:FCD domain-containing protein [Xanthobacteraceae bacterium]